MLDSSGKVIAADIQNGMLEKVIQKIAESDLEHIVQIHKCQEKRLNLIDRIVSLCSDLYGIYWRFIFREVSR
jgi:ubiquinone/menaquinone biosynthesis C-methylase UbiE